jgi:hypothetical protein
MGTLQYIDLSAGAIKKKISLFIRNGERTGDSEMNISQSSLLAFGEA